MHDTISRNAGERSRRPDMRRSLTNLQAREDGAFTHHEEKRAPRLSGAQARDRGCDLDMNPFYGASEERYRKAWNDAWMARHIELWAEERRARLNMDEPASPQADAGAPSFRRFEHVLRKHRLVDPCALDDPEGFDNYRTHGAVRVAYRELIAEALEGATA